ncbi:hypothetical protein M9H77_21887 [Catharanthus roseus]|uniref:Uncharacterized protein n=1 Tax=Catharanthus roseus TaxID=4058 RepID=A0ACC0AQY2_CATRO|nr:hypothetical protein M9H77_21887 [Catharanthus roseus]
MAENEDDDCNENFASVEDQEEQLVVGDNVMEEGIDDIGVSCKKTIEAAHSEAKKIEVVIHVREVKTRARTYFRDQIVLIKQKDLQKGSYGSQKARALEREPELVRRSPMYKRHVKIKSKILSLGDAKLCSKLVANCHSCVGAYM